jgi:AcrR family transcriptional regulator
MRADARRNRERILDAALAAFAERGSAAQMEDVAERAGVGVGTLYRHFPTKEALILAVVVRRLERFAEYAAEALEDDGDPGEVFCALIRRVAGVMAAEAGSQEALELVDKEAGHPEIEQAFGPLQERVGILIRRAQESGALRSDFDVDDMAPFMSGVCEAVTTATRQGRDCRRYVDFALDGLRAHPQK